MSQAVHRAVAPRRYSNQKDFQSQVVPMRPLGTVRGQYAIHRPKKGSEQNHAYVLKCRQLALAVLEAGEGESPFLTSLPEKAKHIPSHPKQTST